MKRRYGLTAVMFLLVATLAACAASVDAVDTDAVSEDEAESGLTAEEESEPSSSAFTPVESESVTAGSAEAVSHLRLEPEISGSSVLIPFADVERAAHVHFSVPGPDTALNYFGYMHDSTFYARADICPNCSSEELSYSSNALSCHECSSDFNLETGQGGEDTETHMPEGLVPYSVSGGTLSMSLPDLVEAYERTATGEPTLFEKDEVVEDEEDDDDDVPACCGR